MVADNPNISKILNILEPSMFPIAISLSPLKAAVTEVTSSGKLVPISIMVKLITFSLIPSVCAMVTAWFTVKSPPIFKPTIPSKIKKMDFILEKLY